METRRPFRRRRENYPQWVRRLIMAWQFKVWPWAIPWQTVKWVALDQRLSPSDEARALELAEKHGWMEK
jgi:hypothetical protein